MALIILAITILIFVSVVFGKTGYSSDDEDDFGRDIDEYIMYDELDDEDDW